MVGMRLVSMPATRRVLLVDDSETEARQLHAIIESLSRHEVIAHAENGAVGLKLFHQLLPDIVCMDIVMPVMDGLQAGRAILKAAPQTRLYMISSVGDAPSRLAEAIDLGARNVLAKPFEREEVIAMLLVDENDPQHYAPA